MRYRARRRHVRIYRRSANRWIEFGDLRGAVWLRADTVRAILARHWEEKGFTRLAGTPLDVHTHIANPYWEILRLAPRGGSWMDPWTVAWLSAEHATPQRSSLVAAYAWAIPSPADVLWIRNTLDGRGVVELGAGNGYWAWQLRQAGINVVAYDNGDLAWPHQWSPVENGGASAVSRHGARALMLIWPPLGSPMARAALDCFGGDLLIYAGEGEGGCTADTDFYAELDRAWDEIDTAPFHPTYEGIHCRLSAYRRRVGG